MATRKSKAPRWAPFPYDAAPFSVDLATLKKRWKALHAGDAEPWPKRVEVQQAWALFHAGDFQGACEAGLAAGGDGFTVANKAQAIHAHYLVDDADLKRERLLAVAARAEAQQQADPDNAGAYYWHGNALGRYSQSISVAQALAEGLGHRIKQLLETAIELQPKHADAHIALASFHAEVIHKVGRLLAHAQGADAASALRLYRRALELDPGSAIARIEYANGLVMLDGDRQMAQAEALYAEAAACKPLDAMQKLDVELAKSELDD